MTAQQSIQQIQGLPCQNFRLIADGSLILYVGELAPDRCLSEWRLHIDAAWRLEGANGPLLGRFDTLSIGDPTDEAIRDRCLSLLRSMVDRRITSIECIGPLADLVLYFDGGGTLRTFTYAVESEAWELRHCGGARFSFGGRAYQEWRERPDESGTEPGAAPNGGPAPSVDNSEAMNGRPSVS